MIDALIVPKILSYYLVGVAGVLGAAAAGLYLALGFQAAEWRWWAWLLDYYQATGSAPLPVLIAGAGIVVAAVLLVVLCPWEVRETRYGKARWAKPADVGRFKPSIRDRQGVVLGRFGGNILMADAPLSGLVSAPAGTGKTAGVIVPSILMSEGVSLIVNDPKGEAFEITAGFRAKLGPVFRVEWNRVGGSPSCFNPLDLGSLPADGAGRGDVIDRMAAILVEGDERVFWVSSGRLSLGAWLLYHVFEAEARGAVPTLAGALHALMSLGRVDEEEDEDGSDAIAVELERCAAVSEANGWPFRITSALRALANYDYRTRANILGTVYAAMRVFLNDNVAEATSRSDFTLADLRGIDGKPVTVYVVVPAFDQEAFGKVTALFVESATRFLTQRVPGKEELQVRFILDEVG
ncbi:MAG: type IV secretory system conjugative DNA transfer family protein, partial [Kiloniellaceae bacterium]